MAGTPGANPLARGPLSPELKRFVAIYALFAIGNSSDAFLILRAKSLGFSDTMTLMTYVFYNFIYAAAATPAGWLSDRMSRRKLMTGGLLVFALVYAGFALVRSQWMVWVLFAFYGLYAAATEGIAKAYVTDLAPAARRGTALGFYQAVTGVTVFFRQPDRRDVMEMAGRAGDVLLRRRLRPGRRRAPVFHEDGPRGYRIRQIAPT